MQCLLMMGLTLWFKAHHTIEKQIAASGEDGCIYILQIDGIDFSNVTDIDLTNTTTYKKAFKVDLCALMKLMKVNSLPNEPSDNAKRAFENAMKPIKDFLSHAPNTFPLVHEGIGEAARKLESMMKKSEHLCVDVSKLGNIALCAICGGLASMGLKEFTPNLWEDPSSAWNMLHRSIAICIFQSTWHLGGLRCTGVW
ncbi:hypothetical protein PQX77_020528 [Marasmius sp. AFHP31]|nr:hypothetical protein PQX77_020528 [Marasmius sp. AFHP31]